MKLTLDQMKYMAKRAPNAANAGSVLTALGADDAEFGLDQPYRAAQFLASSCTSRWISGMIASSRVWPPRLILPLRLRSAAALERAVAGDPA
jgi:predicted chitinase